MKLELVGHRLRPAVFLQQWESWDVWYIMSYNKTDLCCTIQCLFANMQWPCTARLHLISSVSTTTFAIIPQMSTQKSLQIKTGPI